MTEFTEKFWTMVIGFVLMAIPFWFDGMDLGYKVLIWAHSIVGPLGLLFVIDDIYRDYLLVREFEARLTPKEAAQKAISDAFEELTWHWKS